MHLNYNVLHYEPGIDATQTRLMHVIARLSWLECVVVRAKTATRIIQKKTLILPFTDPFMRKIALIFGLSRSPYRRRQNYS